MTEGALAGFGVLLTRPQHQADEIAAAIETTGGSVFLFPVIDIVARDPAEVASEARALPDPDIVIFISSNAVTYGLTGASSEHATIAAIGPATRSALEAAGQRVDIAPATGFDSERLLEEPQLAEVTGKTVRIVRGSKGRELLATCLKRRGARVDYISVYERRPTAHSADRLSELDAAWNEGTINSVIVMSVDSLNRLVAALPDPILDRLRKTPLVTPSNRVIQTANELLPGAPTILAGGPGTGDMIQALVATANRQ